MKIKSSLSATPQLLSLRELERGNTYRDVRSGYIWLCGEGGYVNLTKDHVVTRWDNMPGPDDNKNVDRRYEKVNCTIEIKEA